MSVVIIFLALVFFYSLFSRRLERTIFTAPVVFTAAGMLLLLLMPEISEMERNRKLVLTLAEIALVLILFTDASRTDLTLLKKSSNLPVRLLTTGMVLTILLGLGAALAVFRELTVWEAGILAAILAPTDAGLGQIIVNSPLVPLRIRQALNVEAGLNDGLSVPFLMCFIAMTQLGTDSAGHIFLKFVIEQIGFGTLLGLAIGLTGGLLLGFSHRKEWVSKPLEQLGLVTLPLLMVILSEPIHASMFIAAFVGGFAVQAGFKEAGLHGVDFAEEWGQLLNYFVFFVFGLIVVDSWHRITAPLVVYAILSLTVVRMLPVAISLIGTRLSRPTVLFMGWFGPRGLASIVLGLVYLEQEVNLPGEATIKLAIMITVLLSVFAHGMSALPGIDLYHREVAKLPQDSPELRAGEAAPGDATSG